MREFVRVFKDHLEAKIRAKIHGTAAIMLWAIRWAAMVTSRYLVGKDGRTAQERKRGRRCKMPLATFGEVVWYRPIEKYKDRNNMDSKWEKGVWLGTARESNEIVIGTKEGVTRCYATKRMIEEDRWDADEIKNMKGIPQQPNPHKVGLHIPTRMPMAVPSGGGSHGDAAGGEAEEGDIPPVPEPMADPLTRRRPITHKEVDKYGPTPGCEGCQAKLRGEITRRGHSEKCRKRIEEAMRNDEQDKKKLEKTDERINFRIAKDLEKADRKIRRRPRGGESSNE